MGNLAVVRGQQFEGDLGQGCHHELNHSNPVHNLPRECGTPGIPVLWISRVPVDKAVVCAVNLPGPLGSAP